MSVSISHYMSMCRTCVGARPHAGVPGTAAARSRCRAGARSGSLRRAWPARAARCRAGPKTLAGVQTPGPAPVCVRARAATKRGRVWRADAGGAAECRVRARVWCQYGVMHSLGCVLQVRKSVRGDGTGRAAAGSGVLCSRAIAQPAPGRQPAAQRQRRARARRQLRRAYGGGVLCVSFQPLTHEMHLSEVEATR